MHLQMETMKNFSHVANHHVSMETIVKGRFAVEPKQSLSTELTLIVNTKYTESKGYPITGFLKILRTETRATEFSE